MILIYPGVRFLIQDIISWWSKGRYLKNLENFYLWNPGANDIIANYHQSANLLFSPC